MATGSRGREACAMNSELIGSRVTRSWRRCASCGRFFSFPQWGRAPRDCEAAAAPGSSRRRRDSRSGACWATERASGRLSRAAPDSPFGRSSSTGTVTCRATCSASLPRNARRNPRRPCVPRTMRSAFHSTASFATRSASRSPNDSKSLVSTGTAGRLGGALAFRQDLLAAFLQSFQHFGAIDLHAAGKGELVEDMHQSQAAARQTGQTDRFGQAGVRRGAAIDGYEDAIVHGDVSTGTEAPVWTRHRDLAMIYLKRRPPRLRACGTETAIPGVRSSQSSFDFSD